MFFNSKSGLNEASSLGFLFSIALRCANDFTRENKNEDSFLKNQSKASNSFQESLKKILKILSKILKNPFSRKNKALSVFRARVFLPAIFFPFFLFFFFYSSDFFPTVKKNDYKKPDYKNKTD